MVCLLTSYGIYSVVRTNKANGNAESKVEERANVDIYGKEDKNEEKADIKEIKEEEKIDNTSNSNSDVIKITALGEIMLGKNNIPQSSYALAFKEVASYTEKSDYTVASLATNITSVKDLSNTKTKYIANEDIVNAFSALNVKALNVATDHMLDFSKNMFTSTIDTLKKNKIDVIGLENDIVYAEKDGIRVAFIGVNNVVIGSAKDYIDAGMYIYDLGKVKNSIKEAKTKADAVIVMTHYGKENAHEVTDVMRWFSREIIDAGADMVLGGHSIGIYPVEEYNGKIIIYSLGYLIHDTNNESGKKSAVFNIDINTEGKVKQLEIIPTYIDNKVSVKMYKDINEEKSKKLLEELNNGSKLSSYTSEIKNDTLIIKAK